MYGRLYTNYQTVIDDVDTFAVKRDSSILSRGGEVVVPSSGETAEDIARASVVLNPNIIIGGDLNVLRPDESLDSTFLALTISNGNQQKELAKRAQGKSVVHLYSSDLAKVNLKKPGIAEQAKISALFRSLDEIIALQKRKTEALRLLKNALIQHIFPLLGHDTPRIRFAGYSSPWPKYKFGEITKPISSNTLSRADLNYSRGEIMNIHYGDILVKFGSVLDVRREQLPYIINQTADKYQNQILENGDIIFADAAEDATVGKATEVAGIADHSIVAGLHTIAARPTRPVQPYYLGYYLNSPQFRNGILPLLQGIKVLSLSRANLNKAELKIPETNTEQMKIGSILHAHDELIAQAVSRADQLTGLKAALLREVFM